MNTFFEWIELNEGMSVMVSNHDYSNQINNIEDVNTFLLKKVIYPAYEKLESPDKDKIRVHDVLAPDGDYYSHGLLVLNFYINGWGDKAKDVISGIHYYLNELGVKYDAFKTEKSGMFEGDVVRIPITSIPKTSNNAPSLDMSNSNAILIFRDILHVRGNDGGFFDINVRDLYQKIESLRDDDIKIHAKDPYSSQVTGGPQVIHGGLNFNDIKLRLNEIKKIVLWAIKNHYDTIHVG